MYNAAAAKPIGSFPAANRLSLASLSIAMASPCALPDNSFFQQFLKRKSMSQRLECEHQALAAAVYSNVQHLFCPQDLPQLFPAGSSVPFPRQAA